MALVFALASVWASCASENLALAPEHYANFLGCMEGPGDLASALAFPCSCLSGGVGCWAVWDCDDDKDVDLRDFAAFQRAERSELVDQA